MSFLVFEGPSLPHIIYHKSCDADGRAAFFDLPLRYEIERFIGSVVAPAQFVFLINYRDQRAC